MHTNLYPHNIYTKACFIENLSSKLLGKYYFVPKTDLNIYSAIIDS